jgi:hypothetical protein
MFHAENLDATIKRLNENKLTRILSRPRGTARGRRMFELKDPVGHIIEVFEVDSLAAAPGLSRSAMKPAGTDIN